MSFYVILTDSDSETLQHSFSTASFGSREANSSTSMSWRKSISNAKFTVPHFFSARLCKTHEV